MLKHFIHLSVIISKNQYRFHNILWQTDQKLKSHLQIFNIKHNHSTKNEDCKIMSQQQKDKALPSPERPGIMEQKHNVIIIIIIIFISYIAPFTYVSGRFT